MLVFFSHFGGVVGVQRLVVVSEMIDDDVERLSDMLRGLCYILLVVSAARFVRVRGRMLLPFCPLTTYPSSEVWLALCAYFARRRSCHLRTMGTRGVRSSGSSEGSLEGRSKHRALYKLQKYCRYDLGTGRSVFSSLPGSVLWAIQRTTWHSLRSASRLSLSHPKPTLYPGSSPPVYLATALSSVSQGKTRLTTT
jgi:hypothetical protein